MGLPSMTAGQTVNVYAPGQSGCKTRPGHTLSRAMGHLCRLTTSEPVSHTARQMVKAMM